MKKHNTALLVLRRPAGLIAALWLAILVIAAIAAPLIAPVDPLVQDLKNVLSLPSAAHPLGTDALGRDLLSRLLYGARPTLVGSLEALICYLILGVAMGLLAGYVGGWVDKVITRIADLMFALPGIIIVLVVLSVFPNNLSAAMLTFGFLGSANLMRIVRSLAMTFREELYVSAAEVAGLTGRQIMVRHILPRVMSTVIVQGALFAGIVIAIQAGLGFLGLGDKPPSPSWGGLVSDASQAMDRDPWMLVPAGVPLVLTILACVLLGDAIRDSAVSAWSTSKLTTRLERPIAHGMEPTTTSAAAGEPPADVLLSVRGLSVDITGRRIIDDVSFDIPRGRTIGLVGESGCGKSVTASAILGLVPGNGRIVGGKVLFDGVDIVADTAALRALRGTGIAYVSQDPMVAFDPMFTVGSQVSEAARRHHPSLSRREARERVHTLLKQAGIPNPHGVATRYPHQLSGGLAQRVAIAFALAGEPKLLVCDEPTTALDVSVQAEILGLLHELQQTSAMSILIVTHDWGVVADLCHESVVMYAGQVVERADTEALFVQPLHPYTEGLLGANPHLANEGEVLPTIPGTVPPPEDWPISCHFADRCRYATAECRAGAIPIREAMPDRLTRCVRAEIFVEQGAVR